MKKKIVSGLLGFSLCFTNIALVSAETYSMQVSSTLVSITEKEEVTLSFKTNLDSLTNLKWFYGNTEVGDYKTYNKESKKFDGQDYITFVTEPTLVNGVVTATLEFGLLFNNTHTVSNLYLPYLGEKSLEVKTADGVTVAKSEPIKLNVFDSYLNHIELQNKIESIAANASSDRYVELSSYGTSINGNEQYYMVIAKTQADVDEFVNNTNHEMLTNPEAMIEAIEKGEYEYKIPLLFSSIHASEQPNSDAIVELADVFSKEDVVTFDTFIENQNASLESPSQDTETVELNVQDVLDNFILVFGFNQNPDGDATDVRQNAYGFDPNRDNGYQIFQEQQSMVSLINKYNPLIFLDYHGFVSGFLIEPCTPPHEANTEVDILREGLLSSAHAIGKAGIAQSKYESYEIPLLDYEEGWDDAASAYTATYALFHGIVGHTVEIPEKNEDSFKAAVYGGYGAIKNALDNKDMFMLNKLEIYKRGINKEEVAAANDLLVNPDGTIKGREQGDNPTFFPDYYIIPTSASLQKSPSEANNLVTYFERNGVDVTALTKSTKIDGITYPAGSYVVNMAQAKRGYANHILYSGSDESLWGEMYAEIVMNFPDLRGFDVYPIYDSSLTLSTKDITAPTVNKINISTSKTYLLQNDTSDAVDAVNALLKKGKEVKMITSGNYKGSFIVKGSDIASIYKDTNITLANYKTSDITDTKDLKEMKVYNTGDAQTAYVLGYSLGFTLVDNVEEADIVIDASGKIEALGTKPFVAIGASSLAKLNSTLEGFSSTTTDSSHEGLFKVNVSQDTLLSATYSANDNFYTTCGTWINTLPEGFSAVATAEDNNDFFIAGWWPGNEGAQGKAMVAEGQVNGNNTVIIAGTPLNKARTIEFFNWVANAIFMQ